MPSITVLGTAEALGGRSGVAVESCDHLEVETAYRVRRVLTVLNNFLSADGDFD